MFRKIEGRWLLQDLGSANGTWVRAERIERPTRLNVGDRILFDRTSFVLFPLTYPPRLESE